MTEAVYKRLAEALNARYNLLSVIPSAEFTALAKELFTPEQAEIACSMPIKRVTVEELATMKPGMDVSRLGGELEEMAVRGLVHVIESNDKKEYELLPFFPGMYELQFLKGQSDEHTKRLFELALTYFKALQNISFQTGSVVKPEVEAISTGVPDSGATRVIPVDKTFDALTRIFTYDDMMAFIDTEKYIAAGTCACRHGGELLGKPCDKPKDNMCMIFGEPAKAAASYGFVRLLSKDEARHIVEQAEEAGLVHQYTDNKGKGVEYVCNCCGCHCLALKPIIRSSLPGQMITSDWITRIEDDACSGCGVCIDRCWTGALKMEGDIAVVDAIRCIGCGLCKYVCPADAIKMARRDVTAVQS